MLKEASGIKKIILRCGRTDLRKGIDGLKSIVSLHYGLDPLSEDFCYPHIFTDFL